MFALSVHDGANVNQLQCRSGSLFLAFALISVERRTLDYDSVHLLNIKVCTHYDLSFDGFHKFPFSFISLENMVCFEGENGSKKVNTAIPYRVSTGPEQGFPCKFFPNREKSVFITGIPANENRFFHVGKNLQEKPCFHYRARMGLQ